MLIILRQQKIRTVYGISFNSARKRVSPYSSMKAAQEGGKDAGSNRGLKCKSFSEGFSIAPTVYRVRNLREAYTGELADGKPLYVLH